MKLAKDWRSSLRAVSILRNLFLAFRRSFGRVYRERELILRTDGQVRYWQLTRGSQLTFTVIVLGVLGWSFGMTALWGVQQDVIDKKIGQLKDSEIAYGDLLDEILSYQGKVADKTAKLQQENSYMLKILGDSHSVPLSLPRSAENKRQADTIPFKEGKKSRQSLRVPLAQVDFELEQMAEMTDLLENSLLQVKARMARAEFEPDSYARRGASMQDQIWDLRDQLVKARARAARLDLMKNDLNNNLQRARESHAHIVQERSVINWRKRELERKLLSAEGRIDGLERDFSSVIEALEQSTGGQFNENKIAILPRMPLRDRAKILLDQLANLHNSQEVVLEQLRERTSGNVKDAERIIEMSGLELAKVLRVAGVAPSGRGGPAIGVSEKGGGAMKSALVSTVDDVEGHILRWEALKSVLKSLPLISPVDHYHLASRFGKRRDPFTKRRSMHYGLDLAGWNRSPVFSTAEGVVVFSGRKGRFGRMVEVDHGNGLRTRYAHLFKASVKKGQKIGHRHKVGLLGSTGRSTGPHVHYEVLFDGKQIDPLKFIKAGRNVYKEPKARDQIKSKRRKNAN